MQLDTIGKNIRKYRLMKKFRQEDLAEKAGLTTNYIGMVERGEKIPSLETFIKILNALEVSSDMVLADVLETGYTVKNSILNEKLAKLAPEDRSKIYEVILKSIRESIDNIKSEYPYTMKDILEDTERTKQKKQELENILEQYNELISIYKSRIEEMLR